MWTSDGDKLVIWVRSDYCWNRFRINSRTYVQRICNFSDSRIAYCDRQICLYWAWRRVEFNQLTKLLSACTRFFPVWSWIRWILGWGYRGLCFNQLFLLLLLGCRRTFGIRWMRSLPLTSNERAVMHYQTSWLGMPASNEKCVPDLYLGPCSRSPGCVGIGQHARSGGP